MAYRRISTIEEDENGRNLRFRDNHTREEMTKNQFVNKIKAGDYPNYHVRNVNGVDTPVSNPDDSENNNLG